MVPIDRLVSLGSPSEDREKVGGLKAFSAKS
jgi:hypothetical protein